MLGFETIGNATLICHDGAPILATDPWLSGSAYFGSWGLPYEVPAEQRAHVQAAPYLWISHGHPDHLHRESLAGMEHKDIFVPDHQGGRMARDLTAAGFRVTVLPDAQWRELTPRLRIMSLCDVYQDAALLVDLDGRLILNLNDCTPEGFFRRRFVRRLVAQYDVTILLKKCSYRDADMINIFGEDGERIPPDVRPENVANIVRHWCALARARYFIPFSHFHYFQRADSAWANAYLLDERVFAAAQEATPTEILPPFVRFDFDADTITPLNPPKVVRRTLSPAHFGDDWSEPLRPGDGGRLRDYFVRITSLRGRLDRISFRVGRSLAHVRIDGPRCGRALLFEAPRHSLMHAVEHRIFDDLLIGNFMKTTFTGKWRLREMFPHFSPFVPQYSDNGDAHSVAEIRRYLAAYRRRAPLDFLSHRLTTAAGSYVRPLLESHPRLLDLALRAYAYL